jgi:hypothetical protein
MKGWIASLGIALGFAFPAGAQAPADWRSVVSERDRGRIENWRRNFESAVEASGQAHPLSWHRISAAELPALGDTEPVAFPLDRLEGRWRCRLYIVGPNHVSRNDWFHCRLYNDGGVWRMEKLSGQAFYGGTFYADAELGTVFAGADWASGARRVTYGQAPNRDQAGVLRRTRDGHLRLFFSFENYLQLIEFDVRHRLRDRHLIAPVARDGNG